MSHVFPRVIGRDLPYADRAKGVVIWDSSGKSYIDAAGGAVVVGIGHGVDDVVSALSEQAGRVAYVHGTQFTTEALESYTRELAPLLPLEAARLYPVSGGSEAIETAFKMARAYHLPRGDGERTKIIARKNSYHGNSLNALDASGRPALRKPYEPWLGRTRHVGAPYEYRCTAKSHASCGLRFAEELDRLIEREGAHTIACFIAEPIVGAAMGAVVPPDDYWPAIQSVCHKHGVLLIADEVMTGFGRTGSWFACEHWDVVPDLLTAGKGASSGYWPFGFAACSSAVFETISTTGFTHGFTFSHSVVGAAVGRAVLKRLADHDLVSASHKKGELLKSELAEALGGHPHVGDIHGRGLMLAVEMIADRDTRQPFPRSESVAERILSEARSRGLLLYPATGGVDGTDGDAVMLGPPFVITEEEIAQVVERLSGAIHAVLPK